MRLDVQGRWLLVTAPTLDFVSSVFIRVEAAPGRATSFPMVCCAPLGAFGLRARGRCGISSRQCIQPALNLARAYSDSALAELHTLERAGPDGRSDGVVVFA